MCQLHPRHPEGRAAHRQIYARTAPASGRLVRGNLLDQAKADKLGGQRSDRRWADTGLLRQIHPSNPARFTDCGKNGCPARVLLILRHFSLFCLCPRSLRFISHGKSNNSTVWSNR